MKIRIIHALLIALLLSCTSNNDCLTVDRLTQVKSFEVNHQPYFVYLRISGANEKEFLYELYKNVPIFDDCGTPNLAVISSVHVDATKGEISRLIFDDGKLIIHYSERSDENVGLDSVPVDIKIR